MAADVFVAMCLLTASLVDGSDFDPSVSSECVGGRLLVRVWWGGDGDGFRGIVYTKGHRADCAVRGTGANAATLALPLAPPEACGLSYDPEREEYVGLVEVREHPVIILRQDRLFNVSCSPGGTIRGTHIRQPFAIENVTLGIFEKDRRVRDALFGDEYQLKIAADRQFYISTCTGFAGSNYSLQLTDNNGCSVDGSLMSNFEYGDREARARIWSMFRFPAHTAIHLQCNLHYCKRTPCPRLDCERRRDDPIGGRRKLREELDPDRIASTTFAIADYNNSTLTSVRYESSCQYHRELITALCVLFAVLFLAALGLNCLFCCIGGHCGVQGSRYSDEALSVYGSGKTPGPVFTADASPFYYTTARSHGGYSPGGSTASRGPLVRRSEEQMPTQLILQPVHNAPPPPSQVLLHRSDFF